MQSEFDNIREFLSKETLSQFVSEHRQELSVLRKGVNNVGDAMALLAKERSCLPPSWTRVASTLAPSLCPTSCAA